jgi:hypothetical protein
LQFKYEINSLAIKFDVAILFLSAQKIHPRHPKSTLRGF